MYKIIIVIILILIILLNITYAQYARIENFEDSKYTAIIVEPREHKALSFVLNNFLENLSDDWNIIIMHGNNNLDYINNIIKTDLSQYTTRIKLINLKVDNLTIPEYNKLFYSKEFYDNIPTETFLVFQTDTMILNPDLINNFLDYDYVGAPFRDFKNDKGDNIGNGGLSLRKKSKMLKLLDQCDNKQDNIQNGLPEDVFYGGIVCGNENNELYKPSPEYAKQFSVESIYYDTPFGIHKPMPLNKNEYDLLIEQYPKVGQLMQLNGLNKS